MLCSFIVRVNSRDPHRRESCVYFVIVGLLDYYISKVAQFNFWLGVGLLLAF